MSIAQLIPNIYWSYGSLYHAESWGEADFNMFPKVKEHYVMVYLQIFSYFREQFSF